MNLSRNVFLIISISCACNASGTEWYEGGTLSNKNALAWQEASLADKIASSADFVAAIFQRGLFKPSIASSIKGLDHIAPYAIELAICIDSAFTKHPDNTQNKQTFTNQHVSETGVICSSLMGWLK